MLLFDTIGTNKMRPLVRKFFVWVMQAIIMQPMDFDFANSAVIRPPADTMAAAAQDRRYTRFVVDSRDRNRVTFPSPSSYDIAMDEDIDDVLTAELLRADVPFSGYLIHAQNATLTLTFNNANVQVTLDQGDYASGSELATELQRALHAAIGVTTDDVFTVTHDTRKDKLTIESASANTFALTFLSLGQAKIFGFDQANVAYSATAAAPFVLVSPYRVDLNAHKYLVLRIDTMSVNHSINNIINKSFAILPRDVGSSSGDRNSLRLLDIKKYFNPPVAKLSKLRIAFFDYDGNPYDFQNQDHYFELLFTSFKHTRRYQFYK
jgi:hypothetical protein